MNKFSVLTVAFLMMAMANPTHVQAAQHDMGTLIKDVNFDGAITSIDASCILTTYAISSTDWKYPIKTVTFGVLSTGYQSFFLENAIEYAHDNGISESQVVATVTVWMPNEYHYTTYAIEKPSE